MAKVNRGTLSLSTDRVKNCEGQKYVVALNYPMIYQPISCVQVKQIPSLCQLSAGAGVPG